MELIWRLSYSIWWWMQKHEWTFRFVLWLKQMGVVRVVKHWLVRHRDAGLRKHPNEAMKSNANFFDENKERVERVLSLLADEKSKKVLGGQSLIEQDGRRGHRSCSPKTISILYVILSGSRKEKCSWTAAPIWVTRLRNS